ncbi:ATP-binding protein [Sediminicola sp. YIK13]|uniref:ATP-binding protein n=1 Tax=Sediminicola sp. YIK13 TaxID=1453352 RepID=UPI00138EF238|nr:sensor histidine kinase [Sediminicola sp. YIK13]
MVWDKTEFKYDSIARKTIDFAIASDSLTYASNRIVDLMYYHLYLVNQPEQSILLFQTYSVKLENLNNDHAWGKLYLYTGDGFALTNDLDKAIDYYKKAITFGTKSKKNKLVALAKLYLGFAQSDKGLFAESSMSFRDASQIYTKLKDTLNLIGVKNGLSILYSKNAFYEEARKERFEAIELAEKVNSTPMLVSLYFNAAEDFKRTADLIQQIAYLKATSKVNNQTNNELLKPQILAAITVAYAESDSLVLAEETFKEVEAMYINDKTRQNKRHYLNAKKTLSFVRGDYTNALIFGKEHLALQIETKKTEDIMLGEKFLSKVYGVIGEKSKNRLHLLNYYGIKDSIASVQNVKSLVYYQTLYETEKRDLKIENQAANIDILNLQNKNKKQLLIFGSLGFLGLFGGFLFYRSFRIAKKRELAQQAFSQELIKTQEQERSRVSKDLHDSVGQQLTFLKKKAHNLEQQELSDLANTALEEVRSISRDLYPVTLKQIGLTASIEQLLFDLDGETDMFFSVELVDINTSFDEKETLNFYRFIQESVNNVLKHSYAKTLIVNILKREKTIEVLIKDNGKGFDIKKEVLRNSLGLKTMAERIRILKGNLSIQSQEDLGTTILVNIPI